MIDLVKIFVKGGNGGDGCISFRREKFVPRGGPDGGDGGNGGAVFMYGDPSLNTLLHLHYQSRWRAKRGGHGGGRKRRGANGEDISIPVPMGTVVWEITGDDGNGKELVADITQVDPVLVARGGDGGGGNARFVSSVNQEPVLAESGAAGEEARLLLELKLLADVGIVGQPNAGKSTLISRSSAARPKVAEYPFTTTDPVLGVVSVRHRTFVIMEVPGLVEGAHKGVGLGHEFLRHSERARLLLHLLDGLSDDPVADWRRINTELEHYGTALAGKPQIVVLNKMDLPEVRDKKTSVRARLERAGATVFFISAATGEGVDALLSKVLERLDSLPKEQEAVDITTDTGRRRSKAAAEPQFRVSKQGDAFVIHAPRVERLVPRANLKDWKAMVQIWRQMNQLGIVSALEEQGVQPGDTVRIAGVDLEWF